MKGIILAGGYGTRLYPITKSVSKQLLPIYNKPIIYYPLSTLMLAGIRDILIISDPKTLPLLYSLFSDGSRIGLNLSYKEQIAPTGIPEAFIIGEDFIDNQEICLILGDNIFYGGEIIKQLELWLKGNIGSTLFSYWVKDPSSYGVIKYDDNELVEDLVEKPNTFISNWASTGLYIFDKDASDISKSLDKSKRGELEILDLCKVYLEKEKLLAEKVGRGTIWLDVGTSSNLHEASEFVRLVEERQGLNVGCIEEIAYVKGFITLDQAMKLAYEMKDSDYGNKMITSLRRFI